MTDAEASCPDPQTWVPRLVEPDTPAPSGAVLVGGPVTVPTEGAPGLPAAQDLAAHLAAVGPRPRGDRQLVDELDTIALTGRGGAHFPAARKWRAVRDAVRRTHRTPVVVANAAEGEPASAKDLVLLATRPHLVLDGLVCAAEAVGAQDLVLWTHGDDRALHRVISRALRERAALDEPEVRVVRAPAGYLSGETSAVVRALSGGPALPAFSLEHATSGGVDGRPTLVHNVETLARVGVVARTGAEGAPRTTLATVVTGGRRTVVEADEESTLSEAVAVGGWPGESAAQAVLIGGYGGRWLPWHSARGLHLNQPALRAAGASLGAGVLAPLPADGCGVAETARVLAFLADSGARQCGPCVFGLPALAGCVDALARGTARRGDLRRLERWTAEVSGRGGCHHPDGAVSLLRSAVQVFAADWAQHLRHRPCPAARAAPLLPLPASPA
jgi:NADH:ubiquinone oxidoreductase subunit F (NADH-binding)